MLLAQHKLGTSRQDDRDRSSGDRVKSLILGHVTQYTVVGKTGAVVRASGGEAGEWAHLESVNFLPRAHAARKLLLAH